MRHFRNFEISDIGVLVHFRLGPDHRKSKVVLLQSKRLYPAVGGVRGFTRSDYESGFSRLSDPEDLAIPIALEKVFRFTENSRCGALSRDSDQIKLIDKYERDIRIPVFYHLYNPWDLPSEQRIPLRDPTPFTGSPALGVRVIPSPDFICDEVLACRLGHEYKSIREDSM